MYELIQVSDNCYYINSPAKIGLIKLTDNEVCIIDSGNDKDAGKKVKRIIDSAGWHLKMILNTHSHADHIGGNKYLSEQTGCSIYAAGIECDFTNHPTLEGAFLYGGYATDELRHKFILAQPSEALPLTEDALPEGIGIIPLPGHSFDMVGFRTADGIVYLADSLSSREVLDKYKIVFLYDVGAYLKTLEALLQMQARLFIPAHAAPCEDISSLAQYNIDKTLEVADDIVSLCRQPVCFEALLQSLFDKYGINMTFEQYALVGSTVRSYLSWLKSEGRIKAVVENNTLLWHSV